MTQGPDLPEICGLLQARALAVAQWCLPAGHREGQEWVEACRAKGGRGDGLRVNTAKGVWKHFGTGEKGGDMLDLIAYCHTGGKKGAALTEAKRFLGISDAGARAAAVGYASGSHRSSHFSAEGAEPAGGGSPPPDLVQQRERKRKRAVRLWLEGGPIGGTLAEVYLKARGIDLRLLGWAPGALRFAPAMRYYHDRDHWESFPCLLAAISAADGRHIATHRTYLRSDGRGKAHVPAAKKVLGEYAGGMIRLWRGEDVNPRTGEVIARSWRQHGALKQPPAQPVVGTEGIEDALTVVCHAPRYRVIAAVSLSNLRNLELPAWVKPFIWIADNDAGLQQRVALDAALQAIAGRGTEVRIGRVQGAKDLNAAVVGTNGRTQ